MRTRFLNIDYCNSSPSLSTSKTLESAPQELRFPIPPPPPPPPSSVSGAIGEFVPCFDSDLGTCLDVETVPIRNALSRFLSATYPQIRGTVLDRNEGSEISPFASPSDTFDKFEKKENVVALGDGNSSIFQFETPEIVLFSENSIFSVKEMQIPFQHSEIKNNLDMLKAGHTVQYPSEVHEKVYSVQDISLSNLKNIENVSEDCSSRDQIHRNHVSLPLFEVDEMCLGNLTNPSADDKFQLVFEKIETQHCSRKDALVVSAKELVGSLDDDILKHFSDHLLSGQHLECHLAGLNLLTQIDDLSIMEFSNNQEKSAFNPKTANGQMLLPISLLVFEEFQMLDVVLSQFHEVTIESEVADQQETSGQMFTDDMNFQNFNDLIVSRELDLVDDKFKSLPIPILDDHDKLSSLYTIVEEILSELKLQPLSASDGIYLDWHLGEEDKRIFDIFSIYQNVMEETDFCSNDLNQKSYNDEMLVLDFFISSDTLDGPNTEEKKVSLDMYSDKIPLCEEKFVGVTSRKLLNSGCSKPGNSERSSEFEAEKVALLSASSTQFSDLDFFLNSRKGTARGDGEPAVNTIKTKTKFPVVSFTSDSPAPSGDNEFAMSNHILASNENLHDQELELLSAAKDNCKMRPSVTDSLEMRCMPLADDSMLLADEAKHFQPRTSSLKDTVIVVNTCNFDKEMIITRRRSYQKILAMEKEGAQVVERDSNLPVDIIISAGICLVWYDCRNIGKEVTPETGSSCSSLCLENIATNALTLISYSFSACILVFEGNISFLSAIMESSDGLYAAAASLGIDLQLFVSRSADMTDEIILSCIGHAAQFTIGLYPKMPESETIAESFLTKFPSINVLTAHAICSSVGSLTEFLEWPHKQRIQATQKYEIPDESVKLLSSLCRFMEREDSKSGTTDCSSVSSAPDSENFHYKVGSKRRKKYFGSPVEMNSSFFENKCGRSTPSKALKPADCAMSTSSQTLDEILGHNFSLNDNLFGQDLGFDSTTVKFTDHHKIIDPECLQEDFKGEVIDLNGSCLSWKDFSPIKVSSNYSSLIPEAEKESVARNSKIARRLSFTESRHPTFPTASEINSDSDIWSTVRAHKQNLSTDVGGYADNASFKYNTMASDPKKERIEDRSAHESARNFSGVFAREKGLSVSGETPFSNAVRSAQLQHGSPWTIEFLNRVREKSRTRQQSLPRDAAIPCFRYSGNAPNVSKRKSPSFIELCRYQGASNTSKFTARKRQKQTIRPSSSKKQRSVIPILPTWTPLDKKAQQTLSFATNGSERQTKLVWGNANNPSLRKIF